MLDSTQKPIKNPSERVVRLTKRIPVKDIFIGGGGRVTIQSMTNTGTSDTGATTAQIKQLEAAGCDIARVAVTNAADAKALKEITARVKIPVVADIQFDYRLAIAAVENGAHKIRINPGNIGGPDRVKQVCDCAKAAGVPIRVGINSGSIEKDLYEKYGNTPKALSESALRSVALLEKCGFSDIVISVKSSGVRHMIESNRLLRAAVDYPLHLGVTEAGSYDAAVIKSSIGIGGLLADGIGDTVRVSITGDPVQEIRAARSILRALNLDKNYVEIISCPTCARCGIDLASLVDEITAMTASLEIPLKLAVMGCAVNGPGEAREADLGIAGGPGRSVIFKKGKPIKTVDNENLLQEFIAELCRITG